jgi:hypothetical protein
MMTEVGKQRTEGREQTTEDRGQKPENRLLTVAWDRRQFGKSSCIF